MARYCCRYRIFELLLAVVLLPTLRIPLLSNMFLCVLGGITTAIFLSFSPPLFLSLCFVLPLHASSCLFLSFRCLLSPFLQKPLSPLLFQLLLSPPPPPPPLSLILSPLSIFVPLYIMCFLSLLPLQCSLSQSLSDSSPLYPSLFFRVSVLTPFGLCPFVLSLSSPFNLPCHISLFQGNMIFRTKYG